jgi:hypothetical protein
VLPDVDVVPVVDVVPIVDMLPDVVVPAVDMVPDVEVLPIGAKVVAGTVNVALRPPAPSSAASIGIPVLPTAVGAAPIPVGDEAEAAALPPNGLLATTGQVPAADPATAPPSNTVVDTDVPAAEVPAPDDVPDIELPIPDDIPVPLIDVAAAELARGPEVPVHAGLVPVANDVIDVIGALMPDDPSCVAPKGMRTGGTGAPGPTPSGDVVPMPSGETWAKAEPQPKSTAAVAAITRRVIVGSLIYVAASCAADGPTQPRHNHALRRGFP